MRTKIKSTALSKKERDKQGNVPLLLHLKELRKRLTISFIAIALLTVPAYFLYDSLIQWLSAPFEPLQNNLSDRNLFLTSIFEGFLTKIKFSLILAIVLSLPVHLFHILRFVFPGLRPVEKRVILVGLVCSIILAVTSLYFIYVYLLPFSVRFLMSRDFIPENVGVLLHFTENVFYIFNFLLYAIIIFQFPIVLELLLYLNVVSRKAVLKAGRYIIVGIFVLAAVVTPPDVISQLSLAIPLVLLFYLTILIAKLFKFGEARV